VDVLDLTLQLSIVGFMVGSLAGVGLGLTPDKALAPLRNRRFVGLSLVLSWVVCPAVAWFLLQLIPLDRPYATGLLLLALAPCAPFAPLMVEAARGDSAYLAAFMVLSTVTTVVFMPIGVPLLIEGLSADPWTLARPLLLFVLLPLLAGMVLKARRPSLAHRTRTLCEILTNVAAVMAGLVLAILHGRDFVEAVGSYAIATQVVFVATVTLAAELLGRRLPDEQRSVLTIGICTRNLGAALAPLAFDGDPRAVVMIMVAIPVTAGTAALTARWLSSRALRHARLTSRAAEQLAGAGRARQRSGEHAESFGSLGRGRERR
jgi:bile acid:Na+ symporter, BASS family